MKYYLFVDDERDPKFLETRGLRTFPNWEIARTQYEAEGIIHSCGLPAFISFDHDFGPEEAGNGHDLAKWLVEMALDGAFDLTELEYQVHSMNPIGKRNIEGVLESYLKGVRNG